LFDRPKLLHQRKIRLFFIINHICYKIIEQFQEIDRS
jgi:hypothetical protein